MTFEHLGRQWMILGAGIRGDEFARRDDRGRWQVRIVSRDPVRGTLYAAVNYAKQADIPADLIPDAKRAVEDAVTSDTLAFTR